MKISFEGIGEVVATFLKDSSAVKPGHVVCLADNETVGLGTAGKVPCGVAATVAKDGYVSVQIGGLAEVGYSGTTAPTVGWSMLAADGAGGVKVVTSNGRSYLTVSVDTTAKTAVVML